MINHTGHLTDEDEDLNDSVMRQINGGKEQDVPDYPENAWFFSDGASNFPAKTVHAHAM